MIVRLRAGAEAVRNSLFFVPVLCVVIGIALAAGMLELDRRLRLEPALSVLRFTVESARELLGAVAAAIITVSGIVFALTGLSVQLASSQFSPRVVRGFLRDRSAQVSIGFMVGTFTYSLVVLRAVRSVEGGPDVVPALSTALALGLAVAAVVVIVGFVSRTGHRLQSSQLIRSVAEETLAAIASRLPERGQGGAEEGPGPDHGMDRPNLPRTASRIAAAQRSGAGRGPGRSVRAPRPAALHRLVRRGAPGQVGA